MRTQTIVVGITIVAILFASMIYLITVQYRAENSKRKQEALIRRIAGECLAQAMGEIWDSHLHLSSDRFDRGLDRVVRERCGWLLDHSCEAVYVSTRIDDFNRALSEDMAGGIAMYAQIGSTPADKLLLGIEFNGATFLELDTVPDGDYRRVLLEN